MEFYQLEAFVEVVVKRSFSKAAENLYLSQPTISAHVKTLENELGTPLFDRGKNEFVLTPAGEILFRHAQDLLNLREKAAADIAGSERVSSETLAVAASSVPCQYLLPKAAASFEKRYPLLNVSLKQENSRRVCEDINNYSYALGVVGEQHGFARLKYIPLVTDELVVAIPKRSEYGQLLQKEALTAKDLQQYRLLVREIGSGTRSLLETELAKAGLAFAEFKITVYDSQEAIKQAVREGLGITVISRYVVADYLEFGILSTRQLAGFDLTRQVYLVYHSKRVLSPGTRQLRDFLTSFFKHEGGHF